jgi:hypothetical protein
MTHINLKGSNSKKHLRNEKENININDAVKLDNDMILIKLEVITESNFECLFSTLDRLNKIWETTRVMGVSFLKILI